MKQNFVLLQILAYAVSCVSINKIKLYSCQTTWLPHITTFAHWTTLPCLRLCKRPVRHSHWATDLPALAVHQMQINGTWQEFYRSFSGPVFIPPLSVLRICWIPDAYSNLWLLPISILSWKNMKLQILVLGSQHFDLGPFIWTVYTKLAWPNRFLQYFFILHQ